MCEIINNISNFLKTLFDHDAFEWFGLILTAGGLLIAYLEISKSRKATELSNKQCLFDRRLRNYFITKATLENLNRNWDVLESITKITNNHKKAKSSIDVVAQLFLGFSSFGSGYKNNNDFIKANEQYNNKVSELMLISSESRIIFSHIEADAGDFIEKYINMLKCLYITHQLYAGNVAAENEKEKKINDLAGAINLLEHSLKTEYAVLDLMEDELNLEDKK